MKNTKVLIDTSVWSLALRRNHPESNSTTAELQKLIKELRVHMCGPVRQELLSGIQSHSQFVILQNYLTAFPDLPIISYDYEQAARYFNACRARGIQGSSIDFLICALAIHHKTAIFTTDKDFDLFAQVIPIKLHS
jgi:predicted nucleic acid-binding protein